MRDVTVLVVMISMDQFHLFRIDSCSVHTIWDSSVSSQYEYTVQLFATAQLSRSWCAHYLGRHCLAADRRWLTYLFPFRLFRDLHFVFAFLLCCRRQRRVAANAAHSIAAYKSALHSYTRAAPLEHFVSLLSRLLVCLFVCVDNWILFCSA